MKDFCRLSFILAALAAALPAVAEEDFAFTYRGRITAQQEMPEELEVTYSLYLGEDSAAPVWSQTKTERPAANGAFQSVLSGDGLQSAFQDQKARFLGLRLGGPDAPEQYPRQEIIATPLAGYADAVEMASFSPNFVNAKVENLESTSLSAGDLTVTNLLFLANGGSMTLAQVEGGATGRISVQKPSNGSVQIFDAAPLACTVDTEGIIPGGTLLFDGRMTKGGLLVMSTADYGKWNAEYSAACVTVPLSPGYIALPVDILGPARFWFYEFGN